jgi:hypothetical protein
LVHRSNATGGEFLRVRTWSGRLLTIRRPPALSGVRRSNSRKIHDRSRRRQDPAQSQVRAPQAQTQPAGRHAHPIDVGRLLRLHRADRVDKSFLAQPIGEGVTSLGIPIGLAVIIFTIVITGIYVRRANGEFDTLTKEILKDATK